VQEVGADAEGSCVSRSFLFVPGDSERKLEKAVESAADALIVDLEDSVAASERPAAREISSAFVGSQADCAIWVRINSLDTEESRLDLQALMPAGPAGLVLPKPRGAEDAIELSGMLDVLEEEHGLEPGQTLIMPIATERPAALFRLHEYADATPRLAALTWGAEDLSTAVGAAGNRDGEGNWLPPYELARSLCLFAAAAAGVPAIDTVFTDYKDPDGLSKYASKARRDGFTGMLAIHPAQVGPINEAFMPSDEEIDRARRIVALFVASPEAGTLGMDGEMIDRPHLLQAKRILDIARQRER
jgi:citrate lyase subunit beta/citryl-CoA lyase